MVLKIENLSKRFENDTTFTVQELNLEIQGEEIFTLLGANGAGKTTTFMLCLGYIQANNGRVLINGYDIEKEPLKAKKYVAYVSENVMVYDNFTAIQNLKFFAHLCGKYPTVDKCKTLLEKVGLREVTNKWARSFSKGMRQRLGIAISLIKDAKIIFLDEPTSGLDPEGAKEFLLILQKLRQEGKAIFMASHDIFRAKEISDRIGIMVKGRLVNVLNKSEIKDKNLEEIYLKYIETMG
ncbi:MAG: ABC transporter ATP-binding protein [bacterium]